MYLIKYTVLLIRYGWIAKSNSVYSRCFKYELSCLVFLNKTYSLLAFSHMVIFSYVKVDYMKLFKNKLCIEILILQNQ